MESSKNLKASPVCNTVGAHCAGQEQNNMNMEFNLRGGVIIIGSLLWQDDLDAEKRDNIRKHWRDGRLADERIMVKLPIRYGRYSSGNICTMVFSSSCERYKKLGVGIVMPFKSTKITSTAQLISEARAMSMAEGMEERLENKWGKITILFNPEKIDLNLKEKILEEWNRLDDICKNGWKEFKLGREKSCVCNNSELNIKWPPPVDTREKENLSRFHFLLATATKPKHKNTSRYPTQYEIAETVKKDSKRFYFIQNVKSGITTSQDNSILNRI